LVVVESCAWKIHVKAAVVVAIVGLAWIGLALYEYNSLKYNMTLEKVEDIKQPNHSNSFESNIKDHT
jgi:NADH/NAD ratio-sensing transcriptional regulator Rex